MTRPSETYRGARRMRWKQINDERPTGARRATWRDVNRFAAQVFQEQRMRQTKKVAR
jgi:hypothetical protein